REKGLQETKANLGSLQTEIKEIDKRIKSFTKETALFDRADKLSSNLNENIAELNTKISQLRIDKKDLNDLGKQIEAIRAEEGEVARIANAINDDSKHYEEIGKRTRELLQASQNIEERMQKLSDAQTVIKPVEAKLHNLAEMQQQVQKEIADLAGKDAKITQSHARFKKAESFAERLEGQLGNLKTDFAQAEKERAILAKNIEQVQEKSRKINENDARLGKLISSFDQVDGLLKDVEKRATQLTIAQDKLSRMENSLRDLSGHADMRIEDLSALTKKLDAFFNPDSTAKAAPAARAGTRSAKPADEDQAPLPAGKERKLNEMIFKMHDQGMDASQIARIVHRPISDVELRLHVRKD
ncbi:MAG: hypothetical protein LBC99_05600, partial [Spirochaetota bacterium]|nr:hypothetical protein [Spirochaetota bacterium]